MYTSQYSNTHISFIHFFFYIMSSAKVIEGGNTEADYDFAESKEGKIMIKKIKAGCKRMREEEAKEVEQPMYSKKISI